MLAAIGPLFQFFGFAEYLDRYQSITTAQPTLTPLARSSPLNAHGPVEYSSPESLFAFCW
jgi:hypothetical protein